MRQSTSRAPGTIRNHKSGVAVYVAFCLNLGLDPFLPSHHDACMYIEYLVANGSAPATVRNKVSQVRTFLKLSESDSHGFNHFRVIRALESVDRDKSHTPRIKNALDPDVLISIIYNIPRDELGMVVRLAMLIIYYGALRQSELLPRTSASWSGLTQPTRGDCSIQHDRCIITIKTGKNLQKYDQSRTLDLGLSADPILCPVHTLREVVRLTPTLSSADPLLMIPGTRKALPASLVLKYLHAALTRLGFANLVPVTSLHSLRKAAATHAFSAGCTEQSIKNYGGWSSSAYTTYIETSNQAVNKSLIQSLNK